ncbi:nucleotide pyrophosphohydrolase [Myxococcota bacterium]|nr:nucleotide pyrophosphohydrolase [Myxococcota bacterium]MBU1898574.1 nucleotide pyrophosphohydrolase [Myxococcota bacterium]
MSALKDLQAQLEAFVEARDWGQFHTPKNLAACLSVEAGELLELYMWTGEGPGPHPPGAGPPDRARIEDEAADVLLSLLNFASATGVDLLAVTEAKLKRLESKYPVNLSKGSAVKSALLLK